MIPYPYAAEDHQYYNANELATVDGALLFRQEKLTAPILAEEVLNLLQNPERMKIMAANTSSLGIVNSAELLADLIRASVKAKSTK